MNTPKSIKLLALAIPVLGIAANAIAHRMWMLPSTTVLSGEDQWVSVEAAVSNDLFFPNHRPLRLESILVKDPDGEKVELQNATSGEIRSSFELKLEKQGTYLITLDPSNPGRRRGPGGDGATLFGSYEENGSSQRWRGTPESLVSEGMAGKKDFKLSERGSRTFATFVTCGTPSAKNLEPTGNGFEIDYLTHPNDLFHGETARFRLLIDGQPVHDATVTVIAGDDRFRNSVDELELKSDAKGYVDIDWPAPGRYWLEAEAISKGRLHGVPAEKTSTYIAVLEVLPE